MKKTSSLTALAGLLLMWPVTVPADGSGAQSEQYAVLKLAIELNATGGVALVSTCNNAVRPEDLPRRLRRRKLRRYLKQLSRLSELNQAEHRLPIYPDPSVTFISRDEFRSVLQEGGWELNRERYPAAPEVVSLSYPHVDMSSRRKRSFT